MQVLRFSGSIHYKGFDPEIRRLVEQKQAFIASKDPKLEIHIRDGGKYVWVKFPDDRIGKLEPLPDVRHWPAWKPTFQSDFDDWFITGKRRTALRLVPNEAVYLHSIGSVNFMCRKGLFGRPLEKPIKNVERAFAFIRSVYSLTLEVIGNLPAKV